ncbi:MAG: hypothetical protein WC428_02290 [Candidatus Paceibacterota bacterium]|jgi:hypothetical protein
MKKIDKFLFNVTPFIVAVIFALTLFACSKKEPKKDDFFGTTKTEEEKPKSRITIIDGGAWTSYQIIEVDGHQYLCNNVKGGLVHLESCPCKKKL